MSAKPSQKVKEQPDTKKMNDVAGGLFGGMLQNMMGQGSPATEWFRAYHYPETVNFDPRKLIGCARSALYARAVVDNSVVHEIEIDSDEGTTLVMDKYEFLAEALEARLVYKFEHRLLSGRFYIFNDGALYTHWNSMGPRTTLVTTNEKLVEIFKNHYDSCVKNE